MSGPKVIRIVTREEIIAICQGMLARLDGAIISWRRIGERNGTVGAADIAAIEKRRDALRALLAKDRFSELQTQVRGEITFLKADTQDRLARAASAAAEAAMAARRTANTARSLLESLDRERKSVPAGLRQRLLAVAGGGKGADAINEAFRLLAPPPEAVVTERQRGIAKALGGGAKALTLQAWIASDATGDDTVVDRVESEIAKLQVRAGPQLAGTFTARVAALRRETPERRRMIADSLLMELAKAVRLEEAQRTELEELTALRAELGVLSSAAALELSGVIDAALERPGESEATILIKRAADLLAGELRERAVASRRLAVLQGLASLGYEVTEGMATAWVRHGKVVLRRAASPGYGVEIFGGASDDRLQVRTVSFGTRDVSRDRDMETIWCNEFERLRQIVAKSGGEVAIEKALPVGTTPLKTIEGYDSYLAEVAQAPPKRSLRAR